MEEVPFRVMCVSEKPLLGLPICDWRIKAGTEYEVVRVLNYRGGTYYELSFHLGVAYACEHFATLPDPSEEVAIEHEHEALIYQR